jgi:hypothetical protein
MDSIIKYGEIIVTVAKGYRPSAVDDEGKEWSIDRGSYFKNSGVLKVRRYIVQGGRYNSEILQDWRSEPRMGKIHGVVRLLEKLPKKK